jgi:cysteine desulfurase
MIADAILTHFPELLVSTASACAGHGSQSSHVLQAMGLSVDEAKSAIRFSFGRFTRMDEIDDVVKGFNRLFNVYS